MPLDMNRNTFGGVALNKTTLGMGTATSVLMILAFYQGGIQTVYTGILLGIKTFVNVLPLLLLAIIVAGLIQVVVSRQTIVKWLGKESGFRGIFIAGIGGALIPGGPYGYYPLIASLLVSGAELSAVLTFAIAKSLWDLSRLTMEIALLGPKVTFVRYSITFMFPIIVGIVSHYIFKGKGEEIKNWIVEHTLSLQKDKN